MRIRSFLSFRIRIGGGSGCDEAESGEDVVLEYKGPYPWSSSVELKRMAYNGSYSRLHKHYICTLYVCRLSYRSDSVDHYPYECQDILCCFEVETSQLQRFQHGRMGY